MSTYELPRPLQETLAHARHVGAIAGAGISAESGIPTYRGRGGIYDDPQEGDRTVEALSGPTLRRTPERTWEVVRALAACAAASEPHAGHHALVEIERRAATFTLLTQNVDGLHRRAGQREMIEIHGNGFDVRCDTCGWKDSWTPEQLAAAPALPRCAACGATARPDVVLFGEMLPVDKLARLQHAFYEAPMDLLLVVGTSALFPYITDPVLRASSRGIVSVEVNPEVTDLSPYVTWHLDAPAGQALPAIAAAMDHLPRT